LISFQSNTKPAIDKEFTFTLRNMCGQRHDRDRAFFLREKITGKAQRAKASKRKSIKPAAREFAKMASPES
jgi:hypothetical protein